MKTVIFLVSFWVLTQFSFSQTGAKFGVYFDENKVPEFEVPDPLKTFKGREITDQHGWMKKRRPELLDFFTDNVYGKVPGELKISTWDVVEQSDNALNGKACRKQVDVVFQSGDRSLRFNILMYLPKNKDKVPLFLGCNFYGNHNIDDDEHILISDAWARNNENLGIVNNQLTGQSRGARKSRWAVEKIIDAGYGVATIFYNEIDPDKLVDDFNDGIHPLLYREGQQRPYAGEWGAIAAWAWGLSRAMDYFENDKDVDPSKVIVFGHSRLGKTSLWAGANDERFAAVVSIQSGCAGAALSKRKFGETIGVVNNNLHWFCDNFNQYNSNEEALPVDQHELIALIAPRPVYISSAEEDRWADPRGEFLSAYYASPVYELFGKQGIPSMEMPEMNQPIHNTVAYHIRPGQHDVTGYDWEQYIRWADKQLFDK